MHTDIHACTSSSLEQLKILAQKRELYTHTYIYTHTQTYLHVCIGIHACTYLRIYIHMDTDRFESTEDSGM